MTQEAAQAQGDALHGNDQDMTDAEKAAVAAAGDADAAGGDEAAAAAAAAAEAAGAAAGEEAGAASPRGPVYDFAPTPDTRDYKAELDRIGQKLLDLREKYHAGDLDDDAYEAQREALTDERSDVRAAAAASAAQANMAQAMANRMWDANVKAFMRLPENEILAKSADHRRFLQTMLETVASEAATAGETLDDWELLERGRDRLFQTLGLTAAAPAPAPAQGDAGKPPQRTPPLGKLPPNLSRAPAAAPSGSRAAVGEIASMDNIQDIEEAFAGMNASQRDKLLRSVGGAIVD